MILYHLSDLYMGTNPTLPNELSGHGVALGHTALTNGGMYVYADLRSMVESIPAYEYAYFKENSEREYWVYSIDVPDSEFGDTVHFLGGKINPELALNKTGTYNLYKKYKITLIERLTDPTLARYKFEYIGNEASSDEQKSQPLPFYGNADLFYFISVSPETAELYNSRKEDEEAKESKNSEIKEEPKIKPYSGLRGEYSGGILAALGVLGAVE